MSPEYDEMFHIASEKDISYNEGHQAGVLSEQKNTEREKIRADEEKQRADKEKQRADKEKQRADEEKQRADQEQRRAEKSALYAKVLALKLHNKTDDEISAILDLPPTEVQDIIDNAMNI